MTRIIAVVMLSVFVSEILLMEPPKIREAIAERDASEFKELDNGTGRSLIWLQ